MTNSFTYYLLVSIQIFIQRNMTRDLFKIVNVQTDISQWIKFGQVDLWSIIGEVLLSIIGIHGLGFPTKSSSCACDFRVSSLFRRSVIKFAAFSTSMLKYFKDFRLINSMTWSLQTWRVMVLFLEMILRRICSFSLQSFWDLTQRDCIKIQQLINKSEIRKDDRS